MSEMSIKSSLSDMEGVENVGVAPREVFSRGLEPRVLVYLLVDLAAIGLDVVMEPGHHGVTGTDLAIGKLLLDINKSTYRHRAWALAKSRAVLPFLSFRSSIHFLFSSRLR